MLHFKTGGNGILYKKGYRGSGMTDSAALSLAYILDLVIGDPRQVPHPVRAIGWVIEKAERILRKNRVTKEKLAGVILVLVIVSLTYILFYLVSIALLHAGISTLVTYLSLIVYIYLISTTIATRELIRSGMDVVNEIKAGNIEDARKKLSMIVGRDTESLDRKGILRATIESLSENSSDGIIAPLFYFVIGGLPLAMTYKAINTLDSMIGYKDERYKNIGWASAKLDDIANFIPARITGVLIVFASILASIFHLLSSIPRKHVSWQNAYRTMLRDGRKHSSPNSGIPEAAMAGALGVKLGGTSTYGGVVVKKPYIGEELQNSDFFYLSAAESAVTITKLTSFLGLLSALMILYIKTTL
jgi:adenosylcobinamide-phosphate synthase